MNLQRWCIQYIQWQNVIRIECTVPAYSGWTSKGGRGNELIMKIVREKDRQHYQLLRKREAKGSQAERNVVCCAKSLQPCPTLCDPMDCSPPSCSVHGILQARIREWVAMPFSRGSSHPREQTQVSFIAGRFFTIWATWKPKQTLGLKFIIYKS